MDKKTFSGAKIPSGILKSVKGQPQPITKQRQPGTSSQGGGAKPNWRKG